MENKSVKKTYELTAEQAALYTLSPEKKELIAFVADGYTNEEIAAILKLSSHTVKAHISAILKKTKIKNRTNLAYVLGCIEDKSDFFNTNSSKPQ